jgi:hypothetical protein
MIDSNGGKESILRSFTGQAEGQIERIEELLNRFGNAIGRFESPHTEKKCDEIKPGPPLLGDEIEGKLNFIIFSLREKNEYFQELINRLEVIM